MKKVIIITGTSSGTGKSIAQQVAGLGPIVQDTPGNVFIDDKEPVRMLHMDISVLESIQAGITQIVEACGRIDVVMNHAGSDRTGSSERMSQGDPELVFTVPVFGAAHLIHGVLPLCNHSELMITISSIVAASGLPYSGCCPASQAAPENIAGSLRPEVSAPGIKVCPVQPGRFTTDINASCKLPGNPQGTPKPALSLLTTREKEIAGLICAGLTSRAISGKLFISEATVKTHTSNIYKKLGIVNKMELRNKIEYRGT